MVLHALYYSKDAVSSYNIHVILHNISDAIVDIFDNSFNSVSSTVYQRRQIRATQNI